MDNINLNQATVLAALVITNIGAILGAYVSMRIKIAILENNVDTLKDDIKSLASMIKKAVTIKKES